MPRRRDPFTWTYEARRAVVADRYWYSAAVAVALGSVIATETTGAVHVLGLVLGAAAVALLAYGLIRAHQRRQDG